MKEYQHTVVGLRLFFILCGSDNHFWTQENSILRWVYKRYRLVVIWFWFLSCTVSSGTE